MARSMSSQDAQTNFADILRLVHAAKEAIIVEQGGEPIAVVITPEEYQRLRRADERDWAPIERVQAANAGRDPDEVLADVTVEVEAVRQELYAEQQRTAKSRR